LIVAEQMQPHDTEFVDLFLKSQDGRESYPRRDKPCNDHAVWA